MARENHHRKPRPYEPEREPSQPPQGGVGITFPPPLMGHCVRLPSIFPKRLQVLKSGNTVGSVQHWFACPVWDEKFFDLKGVRRA